MKLEEGKHSRIIVTLKPETDFVDLSARWCWYTEITDRQFRLLACLRDIATDGVPLGEIMGHFSRIARITDLSVHDLFSELVELEAEGYIEETEPRNGLTCVAIKCPPDAYGPRAEDV